MKALIGMSGGVDSSVAAYLTKKLGYECIGATMHLFEAPSGCCAPNHVDDAQKIAQQVFREGRFRDFLQCANFL